MGAAFGAVSTRQCASTGATAAVIPFGKNGITAAYRGRGRKMLNAEFTDAQVHRIFVEWHKGPIQVGQMRRGQRKEPGQ